MMELTLGRIRELKVVRGVYLKAGLGTRTQNIQNKT